MMEEDLWWKKTYDGRRLMMEDDFWWEMTDTNADTDTYTNTNTDGGGWLLVKFPFKRAFPTAAVCAAVRHFSHDPTPFPGTGELCSNNFKANLFFVPILRLFCWNILLPIVIYSNSYI